nr:hypothetical protein HmN_000125800 [Hymenolepis microstoma]
MLQPPTVSYGNTLDRLKRAYLKPSSKSAPFVGTQLSRSIVQPPKDTVPPSSQPLQPFSSNSCPTSTRTRFTFVDEQFPLLPN